MSSKTDTEKLNSGNATPHISEKKKEKDLNAEDANAEKMNSTTLNNEDSPSAREQPKKLSDAHTESFDNQSSPTSDHQKTMQEDVLPKSSHTSSRNVTSPNKQEKQSSTEMTESKAFDKNVTRTEESTAFVKESSTQPSEISAEAEKTGLLRKSSLPSDRQQKFLQQKPALSRSEPTNNLLSAESKDDEAAHKNPSQKNLLLYQRRKLICRHLRPLSLQMN